MRENNQLISKIMSIDIKIYKIFIFLLIFITQSSAKRTYTIDNISAETFDGHTNVTFNLTENAGVYLMSAVVDLMKPLTNYMVHVETISVPVVGPRITLLNRTINACRMLRRKNSNDFVYVFFLNALMKHTNSTIKCPMKVQKYFFTDVQLDVNKLPSFIPILDQKIIFYARSYELHNDGQEENFLIIRANGTLKNK